MDPVVLDHKEGLELPKSSEQDYVRVTSALKGCDEGMWFLYEKVKAVETDVKNRFGGVPLYHYSGLPYLERISQELIARFFDWYAIDAVNYVSLVGWLIWKDNSKGKEEREEYLKRVLPEVYIWRNKVSAHFALASPRDEDTRADLYKSVTYPLSFEGDALYAGSVDVVFDDEDNPISIESPGFRFFQRVAPETQSGPKTLISKKVRWSLSYVHQDLCPRYWPEREHQLK